MWLCTKYGFFSVVCARGRGLRGKAVDPHVLMVRARRREHLERLILSSEHLTGAKILETAIADYPFRVIVPKATFATVVADLVDELNYDNFKNEASASIGGSQYMDFLYRTWATGCGMEDDDPGKPTDPVETSEGE